MRLTLLSLFPEILRGFFESSIMAKATEAGLVSAELVNIRDYATDRHHKCDDEPFGGGAGMLMLAGPLGRALEAAGCMPKEPEGRVGTSSGGQSSLDPQSAPEAQPQSAPVVRTRTIYLTPSGRLFNQAMAAEFAREPHLVVICGRYEGIDQRIIDRYVDDEVSVGDFVLSSGEVAALVLVDTVYRLIPGVISGESLAEESFSHGGMELLEYPQYTRPAVYDNLRVPEVLTSGHHANIARWRLRESVRKTLAYRPELLAAAGLPSEVRKLLREISTEGGEDEPHPENPSAAAQGR